MFCPTCKQELTEAVSKCRTCGFEFANELQPRLRFYFILKDELNNLVSSGKQLNLRIQSLSATLAEYGKEIQAEIDRLAREGEKEEEEIEVTISVEEAKERAELLTPGSSPIQERPEPAKESEKIRGTVPPEKSYRDTIDSEFRFGQKWLLIIGIVAVIFGVAFFLKYSFDRGWIGPAGRVSLAYLWGLLFLMTGHFLRKKYLTWFGLSIYGGGIVILYFATYAAFQIYNLLPQGFSFSIMVLITVLTCATAMAYETQALAILGLVGGFLTPILMSTGQDNYVALFTYMAILNIGILVISFRKRWPILQGLGFMVTYLIYTLWHVERYRPEKFWAAILFLNGFYIIYSLAPFAYYFLRKEAQQLLGVYILILNSAVALAFNYAMIKGKHPLEWMSVITVSYAIIYLLFAHRLSKRGEGARNILVVMLLKSTLFLILTIPLLFSQHWITIFWTLLSALLIMGGKKLGQKNFVFCAVGLYVVVLIKFLFYDLSFVFKYTTDPITLHMMQPYGYLIFERWVTMALVVAAPYFMRRMMVNEMEQAGSAFSFPSMRELPSALSGIFGTLLFIILSLETSAFFYETLPQARFASISVIWAMFSIVLMILGFRKNNDRMRKIALGLLFLTTFKVFLFDIRNISTPYRILSFIVLGLILILISYLYNQAKGRLLTIEEEKRV
ncbi:MAG: DUF2339 domain-containing protein [Syntrophaceae bacterium]|nr:DUF2339 domain-containing protein [Syntrophaceae bacterium]